jgi:hypothetical protein
VLIRRECTGIKRQGRSTFGNGHEQIKEISSTKYKKESEKKLKANWVRRNRRHQVVDACKTIDVFTEDNALKHENNSITCDLEVLTNDIT